MANNPLYVDITSHKFSKGDFLEIQDHTDPSIIYTIEVLAVSRGADGAHVLKYKLIKSSDGNVASGVIGEFSYSAGSGTIIGRLLPQNDMIPSVYSAETEQQLITYEIAAFLRQRVHKRYSAKVEDVVTFLKAKSLMPKEAAYNDVKKYILSLSKHTGLFKVHGAYLKLVSMNPTQVGAVSDHTGNQSSAIRTVDLSKLVEGIKAVLDSGVFGKIVFK